MLASSVEQFFLHRNSFSLLDRYRGRYFLIVAAVFVFFSLSAFALWYFSGGVITLDNLPLWLGLVAILLLPLVVLYFSQSILWACQSLLLGHFLLYAAAISITGYYHSPMMLNLFYIPLIALLSGRAKVAVIWSAISVLSVVVYYFCSMLDMPPLLVDDGRVNMRLWYQWNMINCVLISGILALAYEKIVSIMADILIRERSYFERDTLTDSLTGLSNAHQLERIAKSMVLQNEQIVYGLTLNVQNFAAINAQYGHHTGDQLLQAVAVRLRHALSPQDIIARKQADQFVMLLPKLKHADDMQAVKDALLAGFQLPMLTKKHQIQIVAGITSFALPIACTDPMALIVQSLQSTKLSGVNHA